MNSSHIIIKQLAREFKSEDFECLGENSEKYISFSICQNIFCTDEDGKPVMKKNKKKDGLVPVKKCVKIKFIDSCRFMASSLSSLVNNLAGTNEVECHGCKAKMEFIEIDQEYKAQFKCQNCYASFSRKSLDEQALKLRFASTFEYAGGNDEHFRLLLRKGVYPYEYMDDWRRFDETELPSKDEFYSSLNLYLLSDADYLHAKKVWENFNIKNIGEYHDLYLGGDVTLLSDVFENFRDTCLDIYKLDPAYFYTAPGLSWEAALKITEVQLELLTDIDMLLMVEKGIRGGICQAVKRYAKANNKYMKDKYDTDRTSSFIQYLDVNNLYGAAMREKLPYAGFNWSEDLTIFTEEFIKNYDNNDKGYILEVDVEYPKELHNLHNELPFLPEKLKLEGGYEKLTPNLYDKEKYVVHIRALQQALQHGLRLKKVHRVIEFKQRAWLKKYIDKNTQLRQAAKNDFEKDFFKLMNNSMFGKTMENVRRHRDIKLVTTDLKRKKLASAPNYNSTSIFDENLIAIEMRKINVKMRKPVYLGLSILDLSKILMYEFHYDYIKPKYYAKAELCYMDTDSLIYHIKTDDYYEDIRVDIDSRFDTSNFDKDDENFKGWPIGKNKKVIGLMKDELGGKIITEFIALRPKMYCYLTFDGKVDKKAKGTKKCIVKKHIKFSDYLNCLNTCKVLYKSQKRFVSNKHDIYTVKQNKIALSVNDDKRLQLHNGLTRAHGSNPGLVCKNELLERTWHPSRFLDWCLDYRNDHLQLRK